MKKILLQLSAAAGIAATLFLGSCAYDPYYSSISGSYSSGYGYGYGYGGSGFSTSVFVSTGDPRWGYDPYTYCYYDYTSRRYYDPYLYGYYPIGYRPPVLVGVPHPHGWRPGRSYCPPPRSVRNVTIVNYRDRESAYRKSNHNWARSVRMQDYSRSNQGRYDGDYRRTREASPRSSSSSSWFSPFNRQNDDSRNRGARTPVRENSPVTREFTRPAPQTRSEWGRRDFTPAPTTRSRTESVRPDFRRQSPAVPRTEMRVPSQQPQSYDPVRDLRRSNSAGARGRSESFRPEVRPQPQREVAPAPQGPPPDRGNGRGGREGRLRSLGDA